MEVALNPSGWDLEQLSDQELSEIYVANLGQKDQVDLLKAIYNILLHRWKESKFKPKRQLEQLSGEELATIYKENLGIDPEVFDILYNRYRDMIFLASYAIVKDKHMAEEVKNDIFLTLSKKLLATKGEMKSFGGWLAVVTKHASLGKLRSQEKGIIVSIDHRPNEADEIEEVDVNDLIASIPRFLARLKPEQREVIELFYFKKLNYQQIAKELHIEVREVKNRMQSAIRNLRNLMRNDKN